MTYNPLAGGMLTGRYRWGQQVETGTRFGLSGANKSGELYQKRYWHEPAFEAVEKYRLWCSEHGYDIATTAVRRVIQQPGITSAIIGASRPEQLDASLAAAEQPLLSEEELQWLDQLTILPGYKLNNIFSCLTHKKKRCNQYQRTIAQS